VKDVCAKFDSINRWREKEQGKRHFWFDLKHGFAFCAQPKTGSSSMKRNLLMLSDLSPELKNKLDNQETISGGLKKYLQVEEQRKPGFNVNNFSRTHGLLKFVFVRHPFDRIISAYEDKVVASNVFKKGEYGLNWYNANLNFNPIYADKDNSFNSFVQLVLDSAKQKDCYQQPVSECDIEHHVRPYLPWCLYCDVDYDVIGKLEDFDEDMAYIAEKLNITEKLGLLHHIQHKSPEKAHISKRKKRDEYMSQLSQKNGESSVQSI